MQSVMSTVPVQNNGWEAYGYPIRQPRRTWLGQGLNACFVIQMDDVATPIDRMLVLYIRSYGNNGLLQGYCS